MPKSMVAWDDNITWIERPGQSTVGFLFLRWLQWASTPLGKIRTDQGPTGAHLVLFSIDRISTELKRLVTTPNTVVLLWSASGHIIAANKPNLASKGAVSYVAMDVPNVYISTAVSSLLDLYGSYSAFPEATSFTSRTPSGSAFIDTRTLRDENGLNWTFMIAIPEDDLLSNIKESRKKVIGISVAVAVVMMGLAALLSVLVTLPIRKLIQMMEQATNMDFSSLKNGYLERTGFVKEIANMQIVFVGMLTRFASAIKANRAMAGAGVASARAAGNKKDTSSPRAPVVKNTAAL
ncbi:hypothetical protein DFJ77DRAFT_356598 [Powellomyces hirtus]|nr:hypothetical protein DFJ77DRAFT_356598 [Powellomyces hirtus]